MKTRIISLSVLFVIACLMAGSVSAYVLLSPRRTWDSDPNVRVDSRGQSTITDGDLGRSRTRNAIVSSNAWNGSGAGTVVNATVASVAGWRLGDGIPMLNFRDPEGVCGGNCLAATFTGFFTQRSNGTFRIFDADIVTSTGRNWASAGEACSGTEFFIEGVMVHEVGHLLGLGHSNVSGATMFPTVSTCNNGPASTAADDEAAIRDLY
ncbi:MAG TPA: matrixin family metalloprotease [Thermoanaerobaculia bacterium]|nr:matrixin family metalloprotease [Thermoanaerobaculia bacterium]